MVDTNNTHLSLFQAYDKEYKTWLANGGEELLKEEKNAKKKGAKGKAGKASPKKAAPKVRGANLNI